VLHQSARGLFRISKGSVGGQLHAVALTNKHRRCSKAFGSEWSWLNCKLL
jgi:hypothetical protein